MKNLFTWKVNHPWIINYILWVQENSISKHARHGFETVQLKICVLSFISRINRTNGQYSQTTHDRPNTSLK